MVQAPENIQNLNRYSYVVNNPLNKTDPSGYIFVTLAVFALNALATGALAGTVAGAVISGILTAYEYYGYAKLAIGIAQAIDGGGTAIANFAGGYAKGFVEGAAVLCMLNSAAGNGCMPESGSAPVDQGSTKTDGGNQVAQKSSNDGDSSYSGEASVSGNQSNNSNGGLDDSGGWQHIGFNGSIPVYSKTYDLVNALSDSGDSFSGWLDFAAGAADAATFSLSSDYTSSNPYVNPES